MVVIYRAESSSHGRKNEKQNLHGWNFDSSKYRDLQEVQFLSSFVYTIQKLVRMKYLEGFRKS